MLTFITVGTMYCRLVSPWIRVLSKFQNRVRTVFARIDTSINVTIFFDHDKVLAEVFFTYKSGCISACLRLLPSSQRLAPGLFHTLLH